MRPTITSLVLCCGLVARADEPPKPTVKEPALRDELLGRVKTDQEARGALTLWMKDHPADPAQKPAAAFEELAAKVKAADADNTKWLKGVVERHGWPGASLVGKDGAKSAWLLVQHADADPAFQRQCLDRMAKLSKDEVSASDVAYLTDRVLLAEGKQQRYGTQFTFADGKWQPRPLEDEATVDQRRAEVGLGPLAEYVRQLEKVYGSGPKK